MSSEVESSKVRSSSCTGLRDVNQMRSPAGPAIRSSSSITSRPGSGPTSHARGAACVGCGAGGGGVVDQDEMAVLVLHGQSDREQLDDSVEQIAVSPRLALAGAQFVRLEAQLPNLR